MNSVLGRATLCMSILALLVASRARANCGAEGCPLSAQGLEGSSLRWSFDVGYQYVDQDRVWDGTSLSTEPEEVGHITELYTHTKTWTFNGRAQVLPSLRLIVSQPYIQREHAHELQHHPGFFIPSAWKYEGLGDATMLAQWTALGSASSGLGALMLQGGVKVPTGKKHVEEVDGEEPEPPARPGTGSTDGIAGVQLMRHWTVRAPGGRETLLPVVVSAVGRFNGTGTDGYRSGNALEVNLSSSYGLVPGLALLAQMNVTSHGRDAVGETDAEPHHTGGTSVFATPGLRVEVPGGMSVYGYWQARVFQRTNGPQLVAPSHVIVGATFGFGH